MVWTHVLAWILGAAIASTTAWQLQDWRLGGQISALQLQHSTALAKAKADALAIERTNAAKYQGALNDARIREASLRRDAAAARDQSDGLRSQLSEAARRISAAPPATVAEYAATAGELLAQCSRERTYFAGQADGHAADVRTLREAWPVSTP